MYYVYEHDNYLLSILLGVEVVTPVGRIATHAILLQVSPDLPARAQLLNMKQFNGKYGCLYCENPGSTIPGAPLHRFWPPERSCILRSNSSLMDNAREAVATGQAVSIHLH